MDDIVGRLIKNRPVGEHLRLFYLREWSERSVWPDSGHQPWLGAKGTTWEGGVRVPGIAYWPGMIAPGRESDGLFDITDLFNTSLALAVETARISDKRYIDGIDQSGFLLADKRESARQTVFLYSDTTMTAVRWEEYKVHFKIFDTPHSAAEHR
jgi:arylsulfatase